MRIRLYHYWNQLGLFHQFLLVGLVTLLMSALILGWWITKQIEAGVIRQTSSETSLYVDSYMDPELQDLAAGIALSEDRISRLDRLVSESPFGREIVSFKILDPNGRILYSTNQSENEKTVPVNEEMKVALQGKVYTELSPLEDESDQIERDKWAKLLETMVPIIKHGTHDVIGVVLFYQMVDVLNSEIYRAQLTSWGILGGQALIVLLLLSTFVRRACNTINQQQTKLNEQVSTLTNLLNQNKDLGDRVERAVLGAITFNEHFLRRLRSELHDGPVQELAYVLLRLDSIQSPKFLPPEVIANSHGFKEEIECIEISLQQAIDEIRKTSASMGLPALEQIDPTRTLALVVQAHEQRTGTQVNLISTNLPEKASLAAKITLYRVVQEALNNSFRHAGGVGQQVVAKARKGVLKIEISDQGRGFNVNQEIDQSQHLGISGMRERVESLGGRFTITSSPERGTKILVYIPCQSVNLLKAQFEIEEEGTLT